MRDEAPAGGCRGFSGSRLVSGETSPTLLLVSYYTPLSEPLRSSMAASCLDPFAVQAANGEHSAELTERFNRVQRQRNPEGSRQRPPPRLRIHETWRVGDNLEWEIVRRNGSASTPSGTTVTASAYRRAARSGLTASSAAAELLGVPAGCWHSRSPPPFSFEGNWGNASVVLRVLSLNRK